MAAQNAKFTSTSELKPEFTFARGSGKMRMLPAERKEEIMAAIPSANHKHLTLSDRIYIEQALERRMKFKDIAIFIEKDPSTVSKEIRLHRSAKSSNNRTALCVHRSTCTKTGMCNQRNCYFSSCGKCTLHRCQINCPEYEAPVCKRLLHAPYSKSRNEH